MYDMYTTLIWAVLLIGLVCVAFTLRGRMTLSQILKICRGTITISYHPAKTEIPAQDKRLPIPLMPPTLPTVWTLYDMINKMETRVEELGHEPSYTNVEIRHVLGGFNSVYIRVYTANKGALVQMRLAQQDNSAPICGLGRNMDCSDIGWDVRDLTFYSKSDRELYWAHYAQGPITDKGKRGSHDDN